MNIHKVPGAVPGTQSMLNNTGYYYQSNVSCSLIRNSEDQESWDSAIP